MAVGTQVHIEIIGGPAHTLKFSRPMTPAEQRLILKVRGPQLRAQLMLNLPMLQALPQAQAQTLVNKISEETTRTAKENLGFDNLLRAKRGATR